MMWEQSPIIQAVSAPHIDSEGGICLETIKRMIGRSLADPSLALVRILQKGNISLERLGKTKEDLKPIVQNVYYVAGLLPGTPKYRSDPIGIILAKRYSIPEWTKWKYIFRSEYQHALMLLTQAETYYNSHLSAWLGQQDAFNDALFRAFQSVLSANGAPGAIPTTNPVGTIIDYGNLIYQGAFTRAYPILATHLQAIHDRRKTLPIANAYDKRTGAKSQPLKKAEQRKLPARMAIVYIEIVQESQRLGL